MRLCSASSDTRGNACPDARGRTAQIPVEVPVQRGMVEVCQGAVHRRHRSSEVFEQRVGVSRGAAERLPIEPRHEADEVTVGASDRLAGL